MIVHACMPLYTIFVVGDCRLYTKYENFSLVHNNRRHTKRFNKFNQSKVHLPQHRICGVVSSPDTPEKWKELRSGILSNISCHMEQGLWHKECQNDILHLGLEFS